LAALESSSSQCHSFVWLAMLVSNSMTQIRQLNVLNFTARNHEIINLEQSSSKSYCAISL
jgi:hypothetical protein